jgi:hypothetical protein
MRPAQSAFTESNSDRDYFAKSTSALADYILFANRNGFLPRNKVDRPVSYGQDDKSKFI